MGDKFPSWILRISPSNGDSFLVLNNLVDLCLTWCRNCEHLPSLGTLPCLTFLKIRLMEREKCIDNMYYGIDTHGNSNECLNLFPSLKFFSLLNMNELSEWRAPSLGHKGNRVVSFPVLEELLIYDCDKLVEFPTSDMLGRVKLQIRFCDELSYVFDELHTFPSLTGLYIHECSKLTSLPNGLLSNTSRRN